MKSMQTSIPPEVAEESPNICAWCSKPSVAELTLEKERYRFTKPDKDGKKIRYLTKRAIKAKVCEHHYKTLKLKDA